MSTVLEGTATGLITTFTVDLFSSIKKNWSIKDKKKRLEEVLILIHCFVDTIKGRIIRNRSLKRWIRRLKKAAEHGDRALIMVKRLVAGEMESKVGLSVVSRVFSTVTFAKKFVFSDGGGTVKKVDLALEELETACRNLQFFLRLIEMDISSKKAGVSVRHLRVKAAEKHTQQVSILPTESGNSGPPILPTESGNSGQPTLPTEYGNSVQLGEIEPPTSLLGSVKSLQLGKSQSANPYEQYCKSSD